MNQKMEQELRQYFDDHLVELPDMYPELLTVLSGAKQRIVDAFHTGHPSVEITLDAQSALVKFRHHRRVKAALEQAQKLQEGRFRQLEIVGDTLVILFRTWVTIDWARSPMTCTYLASTGTFHHHKLKSINDDSCRRIAAYDQTNHVEDLCTNYPELIGIGCDDHFSHDIWQDITHRLVDLNQSILVEGENATHQYQAVAGKKGMFLCGSFTRQ